ncbi:MAG: cytochrome c family protein, partial [Opitutaceae bacterium]|nr:cytochrome c family protein [Opitutaceae bacterium]
MTRHSRPLCALALLLTAAPLARAEDYYKKPAKDPLYIGTKACGECHNGPETGHQLAKWQLTAHARAYTSLAQPESREIVRLSGLTGDPYQLRMCLGCHATASEAEDWEKLPEFRIEDGLQCEACHGPGSEYATEELMRDPARARGAGLRTPTKDDCRICHRPKGSHDTVLKRPAFDLDAAWET